MGSVETPSRATTVADDRGGWYVDLMSGTHALSMGDRGRLVIPVEVREKVGLDPGTPVILVEADDGLVLLTREQALARMREDLAGSDLVGELIAERRRAATIEDEG
ncbi:MAG: AbrB/MazE/SpoVT family DNA-binding domain-containing protein [Acidimicrobiales bacterium]|nr:AbrB/MazE/SpoVT family DNA-binding domain-containing protein [Acidimicrobiales bacterium]